jgi:serine/threonine protein kinase
MTFFLFYLKKRSNTVLGSSSSKHTSGLGTASYAAPEQIATTGEYTVKVDIFAAGIVLFELFNVFSSLHERAHIIEFAVFIMCLHV